MTDTIFHLSPFLSYSFYYDLFLDLLTYIFLRLLILLDIDAVILTHSVVDLCLLLIIIISVLTTLSLRLVRVSRWVGYSHCVTVFRLAEDDIFWDTVSANLSVRSIFKELKNFHDRRYHKESHRNTFRIDLPEVEQFAFHLAVSRDSHDQFGQ